MDDASAPDVPVKKQIERATAEKFLKVFNHRYGTAFRIIQLAESPDVKCKDPNTGKELYLEVTLLPEWEGDIQSLLRGGGEPVMSPVISFEEDVLPRLKQRLERKLPVSYGSDTALVIRQISPLWSPQDWRRHAPLIPREVLKVGEKNYEAGVWILCSDTTSWPNQDDIFCLSEVASTEEFDTLQPGGIEERIVGKATWERLVSDDFIRFCRRDDVDPAYRIESPHACQEAILIAFVKDEPESERRKAIEFYREEMVYYCICGGGKFGQNSLTEFDCSH